MPAWVGWPTSWFSATVPLQKNSTSRSWLPSLTVISQLVQPGEWPGVACAVSVVSPSVTLSPSLTARSTFTGGKGEVLVLLVARIVAAFEQRLVALAGDELRAGLLLDLGKAAGVIEMRMRVEDDLDVGDLEAELRDVVLDHAGRLRQRRVHQDQALRRLDDIDGNAVGADIIDVADQLERLEWRGPFLA